METDKLFEKWMHKYYAQPYADMPSGWLIEDMEEAFKAGLEMNDSPTNQVQQNVRQQIDSLIKKWDKKRIELLHFRKDGGINGGLEQSQLVEEIVQDLKII